MSPRFPALFALGLGCLAPAPSPAAAPFTATEIGWLDRWTRR
jgi:hypothetical protein